MRPVSGLGKAVELTRAIRFGPGLIRLLPGQPHLSPSALLERQPKQGQGNFRPTLVLLVTRTPRQFSVSIKERQKRSRSEDWILLKSHSRQPDCSNAAQWHRGIRPGNHLDIQIADIDLDIANHQENMHNLVIKGAHIPDDRRQRLTIPEMMEDHIHCRAMPWPS